MVDVVMGCYADMGWVQALAHAAVRIAVIIALAAIGDSALNYRHKRQIKKMDNEVETTKKYIEERENDG